MAIVVDKNSIRKLRTNQSWTQEVLAEKSELNLRTIQRIEKDGVASLQSCKKIARALQIEPIELLVDEIDESEQRAIPANTLAIRALLINVVLFTIWGLVQLIAGVDVKDTASLTQGFISFLLLFFAASTLLAALTSIAKKRIPVVLAITVIATVITPPDILSSIAMGFILWLIFECSVWMVNQWTKREHSPANSH